VTLVICNLFICKFLYMPLKNGLFSETYPLIYSDWWSFYMWIHYIRAYFWSPYLSHITRSTCTKIFLKLNLLDWIGSYSNISPLSLVYTSGFHMRLPHCIVIFHNLPWLSKTKVIYKKLQHNAVNAYGNRMCKQGFNYELFLASVKQNTTKQLIVIWVFIRPSYSICFVWSYFQWLLFDQQIDYRGRCYKHFWTPSLGV